MDNRQKEINNLNDYKYGFSTDIENIKAPKGLNKDVIQFISKIKNEPKWMLDWRLKAYERLQNLTEPNWQKPKYPKIDYQDLYYYSAPKSASENPKSLDEQACIKIIEDSPSRSNTGKNKKISNKKVSPFESLFFLVAPYCFVQFSFKKP